MYTMKGGINMKRKSKAIITIIIALCVIIGGTFIYLNIQQNKNTPLTLSQEQITTDTNILNEFMTGINQNDLNSYESLTTTDMNTNGTFENVVKATKDTFGEFKSATFKEAVKSGKYDVLIFNGLFTKGDNVQITLSLDTNNKVAGIYLK